MLKTFLDIPIRIPPRTDSNQPGVRPEYYRLPKPGTGDPFFGLSRSHYYELEKTGKLRLVRLRRPGAQRGVTLVPFAKVAALVEAAAGDAQPVQGVIST